MRRWNHLEKRINGGLHWHETAGKMPRDDSATRTNRCHEPWRRPPIKRDVVPGGVYPGGCRRERTSRPHEHTLLFATNLTPVTEKHKNRPQESQEILKMSTTTIDNADQPITAGSEEMEIFTAFPDKRKTNEPIDPVELRKMEDLLKAYMRNPSKRALPSKKQLAAVTSSLFKEGARKLSPKWNKTQLGAAIMHWLEVAISLPERKDQMQTYLEVSIHKGAPNLMDHQITSKEESGELFFLRHWWVKHECMSHHYVAHLHAVCASHVLRGRWVSSYEPSSMWMVNDNARYTKELSNAKTLSHTRFTRWCQSFLRFFLFFYFFLALPCIITSSILFCLVFYNIKFFLSLYIIFPRQRQNDTVQVYSVGIPIQRFRIWYKKILPVFK